VDFARLLPLAFRAPEQEAAWGIAGASLLCTPPRVARVARPALGEEDPVPLDNEAKEGVRETERREVLREGLQGTGDGECENGLVAYPSASMSCADC